MFTFFLRVEYRNFSWVHSFHAVNNIVLYIDIKSVHVINPESSFEGSGHHYFFCFLWLCSRAALRLRPMFILVARKYLNGFSRPPSPFWASVFCMTINCRLAYILRILGILLLEFFVFLIFFNGIFYECEVCDIA